MASLTAGAIIGGGLLTAGGGVASSIIGSNAATSAAKTQAQAATTAAQAQIAMFNKIQANLEPWITAGGGAVNAITGLTGTGPGGNVLTAPLTAPFQPTQAQLEGTPGYQFTLSQGEKAVSNLYASLGEGPGNVPLQGGGRAFVPTGPLTKGATDYATGLASQTYQQQFSNYLAQNQQIYNMLGGLSSLGQTAAAGVGGLGIQSQAQTNALLTGAAASTAGGIVGSANAISAGLGTVGSAGSNAALLLALNQSGLFGGGAPVNPLGATNFAQTPQSEFTQ